MTSRYFAEVLTQVESWKKHNTFGWKQLRWLYFSWNFTVYFNSYFSFGVCNFKNPLKFPEPSSLPKSTEIIFSFFFQTTTVVLKPQITTESLEGYQITPRVADLGVRLAWEICISTKFLGDGDGMLAQWSYFEIHWLRRHTFVLFRFYFCVLWLHSWHMEVSRIGSIRSCSRWPTPQPQQCGIQVVSVTYTTVHGNARSPTRWVMPGIKPVSWKMLVGFISTASQWEVEDTVLLNLVHLIFPVSGRCQNPKEQKL